MKVQTIASQPSFRPAAGLPRAATREGYPRNSRRQNTPARRDVSLEEVDRLLQEIGLRIEGITPDY